MVYTYELLLSGGKIRPLIIEILRAQTSFLSLLQNCAWLFRHSTLKNVSPSPLPSPSPCSRRGHQFQLRTWSLFLAGVIDALIPSFFKSRLSRFNSLIVFIHIKLPVSTFISILYRNVAFFPIYYHYNLVKAEKLTLVLKIINC